MHPGVRHLFMPLDVQGSTVGGDMSELNEAREKLQQALARLDAVAKEQTTSSDAMRDSMAVESKKLQAEIDELKQENATLKAELAEARTAYVALEEVADAVDSRLDTAISSIKNVMSH